MKHLGEKLPNAPKTIGKTVTEREQPVLYSSLANHRGAYFKMNDLRRLLSESVSVDVEES